MRRNTHIIGAMFFGVMAFFLLESLRRMVLPSPYWILPRSLSHVGHLFILFIASSIGGILPDILDPTYTSRHRRFAHSRVLFVIMIIVVVITILFLMAVVKLELLFLYYFVWGYVSHLFLDSTTPFGLW